VRVFDFGIEGETPYLVMDYAPYGTVRKRHSKGVALPLPTILGYVKQVADALQYAHDEHFIHRDIKPENLLVGRRQEILLSDFGIALIAQTSRSQNLQDVAGTASYMAPEQFQGKPRPASDQYALAVMVYEWLTGACPFHGSFTEVASQHLFMPPPPLQGRSSSISPALEQVVLTALAKDPHHRFGSVQAFATAFEQASQITDAMLQLHPIQSPMELASSPSELVIPTEQVTPPGPTSIPTNLPASSSQTATPTELVTPPSQASAPLTELTSPANQATTLPTGVALPSYPSHVLPGEMPPSQVPQRGISWRTAIIGLAGLAALGVTGGGAAWLTYSRSSGTTRNSSTGGTTQITWSSENDVSGAYQQMVDNYNRTNKEGIHVTWVNGPASVDQLLTSYSNTLQARRSTFDVMSFDTVYTAAFAQNQWITALDDKWPQSERANYFPGTIKGSTFNGKVWAAPFHTDVGLIYYRTDIVSTPPNSWDDLVSIATQNASKSKYGYVWQGAQYEGLTCDFVEVLHGYGGDVLDPNDPTKVVVNSPEALQALTRMVSWVGAISPTATTTYMEETSRSVWQNGDAIFMRNWPYAYSLGNDPASSKIAGKFEIHSMLYGGSNTTGHSCTGGWNLAINAFSNSDKQDAAWKFIHYLLGPEAQKIGATIGAWTVTLQSIYDDADVLAKQPLFSKLKPILQTSLPRPVVPKYPDISAAIQLRVHSALTKQSSPSDALNALQSDLQGIVSR